MKLASLFDGIGGFPLVATMLGIEPVWASEIEKFPIAVTKERFSSMKHLGSVCDIKGAEVEPVDIITFGSPCQDLSVAGKRAGMGEGTRSGLFSEAVRIIKEMRDGSRGAYPRYAVWEAEVRGKKLPEALKMALERQALTATIQVKRESNQQPSELIAVLLEPRSQDGVPRIHENGICPTLNTAEGGQRQPCVFRFRRTDAFVEDSKGSPLAARDCKDGRDLVVSQSVRRLTPLECERLQGFPDNWTNIPGASDSARYKALGNSVAIPCVYFILSCLRREECQQ